MLLEDINTFNSILSIIHGLDNCEPVFVDVSNSLGLMSLYDRHPDHSTREPHLIRVLPGQTRCASAYIINKPAAIEVT